MELPWPIKFRIAGAALIGIAFLGVPGWLLVTSAGPFAQVSLYEHLPCGVFAIGLFVPAFLAGLLAYFVSWPYGRDIAHLAVPAGLSVWAIRSSDLAGLFQANPALQQRQAIYAALRWEGFYWLAVVAAGFAAIVLAERVWRKDTEPINGRQRKQSRSNRCLNAVIAVVVSALIAQFCVGVFAQDVRIYDSRLGSVVGQPPAGQITFGVIASFGIAAFVVKKLLDASYVWPAVATAVVTFVAMSSAGRGSLLQHLSRNYPAVFFQHSSGAILPVQMVAFGTLGSLIGFWLAVRYNYWRKHIAK